MELLQTIISGVFGFSGIALGSTLVFFINSKKVKIDANNSNLKSENQAFDQMQDLNDRLDIYVKKSDDKYTELDVKYEQLRRDYKRDLRKVRELCKTEMEHLVTEALRIIKEKEGADLEISLLRLSQESRRRIDELAELANEV